MAMGHAFVETTRPVDAERRWQCARCGFVLLGRFVNIPPQHFASGERPACPVICTG